MDPKIWGPPGWIFLHFITFGYPDNPTEEDKQNYKNFFINIKNVLPCQKCRDNYEDHLKKYPLNDQILSNKTQFIKWFIDIHNEVNKITNDKKIEYKDMMVEYFKGDKKKNNYYNYSLIFVSVLFFVFFILYYLYSMK